VQLYLKTPEAARELGVTYHRLMGLIRFGRINPPQRDGSGDYVWDEADIARAREALQAVRRPALTGGRHGA
jgi:DNA-binding transcriptional MerR regulator